MSITRAIHRQPTEELKPCPFCGGNNLRFRLSDIEGWIAHVECTDCDDMLGPMSEWKHDEKEDAEKDAAAVWNKRASLEATLSAAEPAKTDCEFCKGSGVEFILAGHGNINEEPCSTCCGTGKEGRHSICRDCDEIQVVHKPFAFNVRVEGWGEELLYTEYGARSLITRLHRTKSQDGKATITPLYAAPPAPSVAVKAIEAVWKYSLVIESSVRRGDGPDQYAGVTEALRLVKEARSSLSAQVQDVAGWQLVPTQPTEDMLDAYWGQTGESEAMRSRVHSRAKILYHVMLAAAPAKQEGGHD